MMIVTTMTTTPDGQFMIARVLWHLYQMRQLDNSTTQYYLFTHRDKLIFTDTFYIPRLMSYQADSLENHFPLPFSKCTHR